ncbi:MAG: Uma2 family endonuclease [Gemmatimonadota bacterium]
MALPRITWQDVQQLPDDGHRHEAIEGELHVTPAPSFRHQRISQRLERALVRLLEEPGHGIVVDAPIGVEFADTGEGVQPDIVFVSARRRDRIVTAGIRGAPDLVVEILSPNTEHRDRGVKRKLYERQGVRQYWIVDPDAESVEVRDFAGHGPGPAAMRLYSGTLPVTPGGEELGAIDLADVFRAD